MFFISFSELVVLEESLMEGIEIRTRNGTSSSEMVESCLNDELQPIDRLIMTATDPQSQISYHEIGACTHPLP